MIVLLDIGIIFGAGIVALLIFGSFISGLNQRKRCRKKIDATVLEIINPGEFDENNIKKRFKRGLCEFEYVGIMYETKMMKFSGLDENVKEGDAIEIYINLNKPTEAVLKNKKSNKIFFGIYVGGLLLAIFVMFFAMYDIYYTLEYGSRFERAEQRRYEREHPAPTPMPLITPAPIDYKMIEVNYFGIIKSIPSNFTKPIYVGNTAKTGYCSFYDKNIHEEICSISIEEYKDREEEIRILEHQILTEGVDTTGGTMLFEERVEEVERKTIGDIEYVIKRKIMFDDDFEYRHYRYYAYWFTDKERVYIVHRTSEEQLRNIVVNSLKNRTK